MWVVDTCVLIDVLDGDPRFGQLSAVALRDRVPSGLVVSPVTYVELAPAFGGSIALQDQFLRGVGASHDEPWTTPDTIAAHQAWNRVIVARRKGGSARRPIADVFIGAFALRFEGLLTRNPGDFASLFPGLRLHDPTAPPVS